jgi:hypothetical protein
MGKQNPSSLGRALFKSRFSKSSGKQDGKEKWVSENNVILDSQNWENWQTFNKKLHTSDLGDSNDWNKLNLNSITEQNSLDEFLSTAELAGVEFESGYLNFYFFLYFSNKKKQIFTKFK